MTTVVDLVVVNDSTNNVGVFIGYSNGTFAKQTIYSTDPGSAPTSVAVNNLNNDQWLDLIFANGGLNNVGIFLGSGNRSFALQLTFSTGFNSLPCSVAIGDLNNDN
jgi:hypothetical protein